MDNDHICIMDFAEAYWGSDAEKDGISIDEWEKNQVWCTYCSDTKGEQMCPGTVWKLTGR